MTTISNADEIDYDIKSHKAPSLNVIDRQPPKPFIPQETVVLKNCPIEVCLEDVDVCGFSGNHPLITLPQINWKHLLYNLDIKGIGVLSSSFAQKFGLPRWIPFCSRPA